MPFLGFEARNPIKGDTEIKILIVSDYAHPRLYEHFNMEWFLGTDLILSAGDLDPNVLSFIVSMFNKPCYYVRGNHDKRYETYDGLGCIDANRRVIDFNGLKILGLEGCMWYGGRGVEYTERQMRRNISRMRFQIWRKGGIDMVLTHAPPKGVHDGEDLCHTGYECFLKLIEKYHPKFFIHGHSHHTYGYREDTVSRVHDTTVINVYGYHILEV